MTARVYIPRRVAEDIESRELATPPYDRICHPGPVDLSLGELRELFEESVFQGWYTDAWDDKRTIAAYRRLARKISQLTGWRIRSP